MKEFVTLSLREKDWTFRALDLDQMEQLEPEFTIVGAATIVGFSAPKEFLQAVATIASESLKFKHPDMTPALARTLITLGTMSHVVDAIRGVSGLEPGDAPAGEAAARAA